MKGVTTIIIAILIGLLIFTVLNYKKRQVQENFPVEHDNFKNVYDKSVNIAVEQILNAAAGHVSMLTNSKEGVENAIKSDMTALYQSTTDHKELLKNSGYTLAESAINRLTRANDGKLLNPDFSHWISTEIVSTFNSLIGFNYMDKYHFPTENLLGGKVTQHPEDVDADTNHGIASAGKNPISKIINVGAPPAYAGQIPKPVNQNQILLGLNHGGQSASFVSRPTTDIRGLAPNLLKILGNMDSTQNSHGLQRSGKYGIIDLLEGGKGLCNVKAQQCAINNYVSRVGNKHWDTFINLRDKMPKYHPSKVKTRSNIIEQNIINDIIHHK